MVRFSSALASKDRDGRALARLGQYQRVSFADNELRGTLAQRPRASLKGRRYYASDTGQWFRDNGDSWDQQAGWLAGSASTYTQTYATAARTVNAYTPNAQSSAYTGAADAEAKLADLNALRTAYETLRASHDNLLQVVTALIDDLQAVGLVG